MINPVVWFEIYVTEMPRAKKFYEAVFQIQLNKMASPAEMDSQELEMWAFPSEKSGYGAMGALVKMAGFPSGGNSTVVYFNSENCTTELLLTAKNGGTVVKEKFAIGEYGFIALITDTEGNMIGLHSLE
ncbi:VOC family protein [Psychromonas sp.]|uniref:VOC family protein n=1 Tax=Psychromonas sp. TaxID=1884585 RepID=UPI0035676B06